MAMLTSWQGKHCSVLLLLSFIAVFADAFVIVRTVPSTSSSSAPTPALTERCDAAVAASFATTLRLARRNSDSSNQAENVASQSQSQSQSQSRSPQQQQQPIDDGKRRKKRNKYANFSKADKVEFDPFEQLIQESTQKAQEMEERQVEAAKPKEYEIPDSRLQFPSVKEINPYDPQTFGYVEIGTITGPHGVHGWTKVKGATDFPERLTKPGMLLHIKSMYKRAPRKAILTEGKQVDGDGEFLIHLQGVYDRAEAQKLKGATLYYATQEDTIVEEDEILVSDLVGLYVYHIDDDKRTLGTVDGIVLASEMCAIPGIGHDYLELKLKLPNKDEPDLVLIPHVPEIVKDVQLDKRQIVIDPPTGLLDLTYIREEKVIIKGYLPEWKEK